MNEIDFSVLRDVLGVSDANLSKHLKVLADAGFIKITKSASPTRNDSRRLTWVKLTGSGQKAFDAHLEELRIITAGFTDTSGSPGRPAADGLGRPRAVS